MKANFSAGDHWDFYRDVCCKDVVVVGGSLADALKELCGNFCCDMATAEIEQRSPTHVRLTVDTGYSGRGDHDNPWLIATLTEV